MANNYIEIISQSIPPIYRDLWIDKGSDFTLTFRLKDGNGDARDITNQSFRAQFRKHYYSSNVANLNISVVNVSTAEVTLSLNGSVSANVTDGRYIYDVEMYTSNTVSRVMQGTLTITPDATR